MNAIHRVIVGIASAAFLALGGITLATPAQAQPLGTGTPPDPLGDLETEVTNVIGVPLSL